MLKFNLTSVDYYLITINTSKKFIFKLMETLYSTNKSTTLTTNELYPEESYPDAQEMETFHQCVIQMFKFDKEIDIDTKIFLTSCVINNCHMLTNLDDFFEEECHLSLVDWIYNLFRFNKKNNLPFDQKLRDLLNNILIIFEILPIKTKDLLSLKIFEKLNKIRKFIKHSKCPLTFKLKRLLKYWKGYMSNDVAQTILLMNQKRKREKEDLSGLCQNNEKVNILISFSLFKALTFVIQAS